MHGQTCVGHDWGPTAIDCGRSSMAVWDVLEGLSAIHGSHGVATPKHYCPNRYASVQEFHLGSQDASPEWDAETKHVFVHIGRALFAAIAV